MLLLNQGRSELCYATEHSTIKKHTASVDISQCDIDRKVRIKYLAIYWLETPNVQESLRSCCSESNQNQVGNSCIHQYCRIQPKIVLLHRINP